jgi:hypothetical protein
VCLFVSLAVLDWKITIHAAFGWCELTLIGEPRVSSRLLLEIQAYLQYMCVTRLSWLLPTALSNY